MTAGLDSTWRDVVPRWRSVQRTIEAGEFQRLTTPKELDEGQKSAVSRVIERWKENRDQVAAAEVVGAALVVGEPAMAEDAAQFLSKHGANTLLRDLGNQALGLAAPTDGTSTPDDFGLSPSPNFIYGLIAKEKARIRNDSRDAIAWSDLARRYTIVGQFEKAERALKVALSIAPSSRYLHRVAARFYVHSGQSDKAYQLLARFERTQNDPWLLAAFLSVASVAGIRINSLKTARRILDDARFRPNERAELASEVGTFDLRSGSDRQAKRLFEMSLAHPTDNSLAQVEWASRRMPQLSVPLSEIDVPFAAEAHALASTEEGDWEDALRQTRAWLDDQPFDSRAALHGSYITAVAFERWEESIAFAEMGLRARPGHLLLTNNLAYALIENGQLEKALKRLGSIDTSDAISADKIALTATVGLLQFRLGNVADGQKFYRQAIDAAKRTGDRDQGVMARAMLLREEVRGQLSSQSIGPLLFSVRELTREVRNKGVLLCIKRVEELILNASDD